MTARHRRSPNPLLAALASSIVPGWGQYLRGWRRSGTVLVWVTAVLVVAGVALVVAAGPGQVAEWLVVPEVLLALLVVNLGVLAFRVYAVADAGRGVRGGAVVGLALILALVAVPHGIVAWGQIRTYTFLGSVFGEDPVAAPPTTQTTTTTIGASTDTAAPRDGTTAAPTTTAATTTTSTVPWQGRDRLNVLLLGGDAGPGRTGVRTDTIILASIGVESGDVALFGFPRNLTRLSFTNGTAFTAYDGILNEVYPYGAANPERFGGPDPGATAVADVVTALSGIRPDYFVLVDLAAFVEAVDALGGVTMYVPEEVYDPGYPREDGAETAVRIEPGVQRMDGTTALAYVRIRHGTSDYDRMQRQRCFLSAAAAQLQPGQLLRALPSLLDTIEQHVTTDIPLEALPDLVNLAGRVDATDALTVGFGPPDWHAGYTSDGFPIPDTERIHAAVQLATTDPVEARQQLGLDRAAGDCGFGDDPTTPAAGPSTTTGG